MKVKTFDKAGKESGTTELPKNFSAKVREDILAKAFQVQKNTAMQPYGAKEGAGAQYSASGILKHRRSVWKTTYGKGISRVPRKIMSRNGASFNWVGATVSSARGGRKPHAPRAEKNLTQKINKKEMLQAFNSALTGTVDETYIEKKYGIRTGSGYVFNDEITTVKTKEFLQAMQQVFKDAYAKILQDKSVRAGRGKMRGRKYKQNAGMIFVIGNNENMKRSGITIKKVKELKITDLSPNGEPGRLACYTQSAIKDIMERFK